MQLLNKIFKFIIIFWSYEVILAWILSIFSLYNTKIILLGTLVFFAIVIIYIDRRRNLIRALFQKFKQQFAHLKRLEKILTVLAILIWIGYFIFNLGFIILSPATNWDSMTYHLTKVTNANQTGSFWYDPNVNVARVNIFGSNDSILDGVAFSLVGSDAIVELPQLIASILIPMALFYIGVKFFKFRKSISFIASLSILTVPLFFLEAITTQNDLIFSAILLLSIIFVEELVDHFNLKNLIFPIFAIALMAGTKYHGIIVGGILGIFILIAIFRNLKKINSKYIFALVFSIPFLILIAIPNNIIGLIYYKSFFALDAGDAQKLKPGLETIWTNIQHFLSWFYLRGPEDPRYFSHDVSHPGYLNMLALPLGIVIAIISIIKKRFREIIFFSTILGTLSVLFLIRSPDDWDLRLIIFVPISLIYIVTLFLISQRNKFIKVLSISILILIILLNTFLILHNKEYADLKFFAKEAIQTKHLATIGDYYKSKGFTALSAFEEDNKDKPVTVIMVGNNDSPIYPYYGIYWQNKIDFEKIKDISNDNLTTKSWDYLVIYYYDNQNIKDMIVQKGLKYKKITSDFYADIYKNN